MINRLLRGRMFAFPDDFAIVLNVGVAFGANHQHHGIAIQLELVHQRFALRMEMNRRQQAETDGAGFAGNNARILAGFPSTRMPRAATAS